jgi:hypothetical protein
LEEATVAILHIVDLRSVQSLFFNFCIGEEKFAERRRLEEDMQSTMCFDTKL